jgi:hypothetical protein
MPKETVKNRIKNYVQKNRDEIVAGTAAAAVLVVYVVAVKSVYTLMQHDQMVTEHYNQLRLCVAAGHKFEFDPVTDTLWDLTLNPNKVG